MSLQHDKLFAEGQPTVAYLVNQYPKGSHTFIRREIAALEEMGMAVVRLSLREPGEVLVDPQDVRERARTRIVLAERWWVFVAAFAKAAVRRPAKLASALRLAIGLGLKSDRGWWRHLAYLAEACLLVDWLSQWRISHLHAHFGTNPATVALLCQELGGPGYSFTVHGPEEFDKPEALGLDEKIRRARFVVAISHFGRSQLLRWCDHKEWSKIHVVRCGVDRAFLEGPKHEPVAAPRFVFVGRLCREKAPHLAIDALARIAAETSDVELIVLGDGPLRGELETLVQERGVGRNVRFVGWQSSEVVQRELIASRALVLPSFAEGLPVVLMEALALHRPVISTTIAGIPELVVPGVCGWLVPPGTIEPLVAAMREALAAPSDRLAQMGAAGAQRVAEMHNATTEAGKLKDLYRSEQVP